MAYLTYEEKKKIADDYILKKTDGFACWDTLPDRNSLHHADTAEEIHALCDERLEEELFPDITD